MSLSGTRSPTSLLRPHWPQPGPGAGEEGASGRGLVASAQDGGLGGAVLALAERARARRAGAVHEASDAAPPSPRPGELNGGWALGARATLRNFGRVAAGRPFWDAAPQGTEWKSACVWGCFPARHVHICSLGWMLGPQVHPLDYTSPRGRPRRSPLCLCQ